MKVSGNRVFLTLIKEVEAAPAKTAGLYLEEDVVKTVKKPTTAIVAHIGTKVENYEVGQKVYIGEFYSAEQVVEGVKYVIVKEDDIIAKL